MDKKFIENQEEKILKRLEKYLNRDLIEEQLQTTGDISEYQYYKNNIVSRYLLKALIKIKNKTYGICESCGKEILKERLALVPGALTCVSCDSK